MSGIVGLFVRCGNDVLRETVSQMNEAISHRGPDGVGLIVDGSLGFGHQLLHSTPESKHANLLQTRDGLTITADVRIDNRNELLSQLGFVPSSSTDPITDSELVLEAYRQWGEESVDHLVGAFAFAIWDREKERVFCARDHMGIKPFYYHISDDIFGFSSEIKSLFRIDSLERKPHDKRVAKYLTGDYDEVNTFYRGVFHLPPGHTMVVTKNEMRTQRYWSLDPSYELELDSDREYEQRFRELFREAVQCRLRSPGSVGLSLSGGIDSSSIACMAHDILAANEDESLHTLSEVFDSIPVCDERKYIDEVLDHGEFNSHFISGEAIPPLLNVESHLDYQDEPFYPALCMLGWGELHEIDRRGLDLPVLLSGYGGDQVACSDITSHLRDLARTGHWMKLAKELNSVNTRNPGYTYEKMIRQDILAPFVPPFIRRLRRAYSGSSENRLQNRITTVDVDFAQQISSAFDLEEQIPSKPPRTQRNLHFEGLTQGEPLFNLEVADRQSAAFGVEPRYPYFDKRLVEFCLSLPTEQKIGGGFGRLIVRNALKDLLPPAIRWRSSKVEFSANVVHGVLSHDRELIEETIFTGSPLIEKYFDIDGLRESYDRLTAVEDVSNGVSAQVSYDSRNLLIATTLEIWLQKQRFEEK